MAWTQANVDALKAAIATGALTVRYGDVSTTYRSLAEMRETLSMMEREVAEAAGTTRRRLIGIYSSKGL